ncbi:hypothetical protein AOQ84DRAFT_266879, partial [Glonium stellatum]
DGGSVMGLLFEYIENIGTLDIAASASHKDKMEWAKQIQDTVNQLHVMNIVWGDVKLDNVLIDNQGRAWIINFGGGCAPDWVFEEIEGTKEVDMQGL